MAKNDRFPELAQLKSEWPVVRVADLFEIQQGKQVSKKNRIGNNQQPFLRTKNVMWGRLDLSELDQMHFTERDEKRLALQGGDLLLCEGGSVGRTAIWRGELERCYYQNHLHRLRVVNGQVVPLFALYWFWYAFEHGNVYFGRKNVTTIPNMSKSRLGGLPMPRPGIPEQQRIAVVLSLVQQAIEQQEQKIAQTNELKKAIMHKLFTEGTSGEYQKQTEIGPIPESWKVVQLKDVIDFIDYGLSKAIPKITPPNGVKIVSTADITRDGELLYWKIRKTEAPVNTVTRLTLKDGDVLFNWRNSLELIGKTTIYEEQPELHIFASFILRIKCDEKKSHNYFIKHLMNHWRERGVFIKLARRAVNQANYNRNEIYVLKIPQPDYEEQVKIAETIKVVENRIGSLVDTRNCFQFLFRTLLHKLMTAEIRVNDLNFAELEIEIGEELLEIV